MKRKSFLGLVFIAGIPSPVFPSAGYAKDGLESVLFLGCFLLFVAGILQGVNYFNKNGLNHLQEAKSFIKKKLAYWKLPFNLKD